MTEEEVRRHWKMVAAVMSAVILFAAFTTASGQILWMLPAHRGFVLETAGKIENQILGLRVDLLTDRKLNLNEEKRKLERSKGQREEEFKNSTTPTERRYIQESLERLYKDLEEVTDEQRRIEETIHRLQKQVH